jgi:predicted DNA binding CopG/RHH family protein
MNEHDNFLSDWFFKGNRGVYVDTRFIEEINCYETMVFRATKYDNDKEDFDPEEYDMNRYDNWSDAEKGHKELYEKWKKIVYKMPNGDLAYFKQEVV